MTTRYCGQADVARWCEVSKAAVSNWIKRHPGEAPEPDVIILNEGSDLPVRGWLPGRRPEWEQFAADRSTPERGVAAANASRARKAAALIEEGVSAGKIDPAEAVRLLAALIGRAPGPGED